MIWTSIMIALQAIRRQLLRSILTVLGVVIGVWSVVTMVTLGDATTEAVSASISELGSNTLTLIQGQSTRGGGGGGGSVRPFSFEDVAAIGTQIAGVTDAVPTVTMQKTAVANAANWKTTITGTTSDYMTVQQWPVVTGRSFTPQEEASGAAVCILGKTVNDRLLGKLVAEETILRIGDISCTVIGTLKERGQGFGSNPDDSILLPIKAAQRRLTGSRNISSIIIAYDPAYDAARVKNDLVTLMREQRYIDADSEDDFSIFDARQIADTVSATTTTLTALLAAVAAVSLVVGGIGIMNIMLVSVTERTREIGIRLAVGAIARDVQLQFMIEAVVLSALGGVIGLVLASLTTALVAPLIGVEFQFNLTVNIIAVIVSGAVGVVFGYVPARTAASLNPIEALRHE